MRLFNKNYGQFNDKPVHEYIELKGKITRLTGDLYHYSYPDIETYLRKLNEYALLGAESKKK